MLCLIQSQHILTQRLSPYVHNFKKKKKKKKEVNSQKCWLLSPSRPHNYPDESLRKANDKA